MITASAVVYRINSFTFELLSFVFLFHLELDLYALLKGDCFNDDWVIVLEIVENELPNCNRFPSGLFKEQHLFINDAKPRQV